VREENPTPSSSGLRVLHLRQLPAATPPHPRGNAKTRYEIRIAQANMDEPLCVVFVTGNAGKLREVKAILLQGTPIEITSQALDSGYQPFYLVAMVIHASRPFDQSQKFKGQLRKLPGRNVVERLTWCSLLPSRRVDPCPTLICSRSVVLV
jgi:hypothetical protein